MQMKKFFITGMVSMLLLGGGNSNTEASADTITPIPVSKYSDYRINQDWSKPTEWGINKEIMKGYINQPHPTTKKFGTWINPNGRLTEYQYLIMLFRYLAPSDLAAHEYSLSLGPYGFWWNNPAKPVYSLAWQLNTPYELYTKFTPNKTLRRGDTARILASSVTGKYLNESEAVQWLYDNGVSIGFPDKNGNYPKTYESFRAEDLLTRGQGITFLHRYSLTNLPKKLRKIPFAETNRVEYINKTVIEPFNANNPDYQVELILTGSHTLIFHDSYPIMAAGILSRDRSPLSGGERASFFTRVGKNPELINLAVDYFTALPDFPIDKETLAAKMMEAMEEEKGIVMEKNGYTLRMVNKNNITDLPWTNELNMSLEKN